MPIVALDTSRLNTFLYYVLIKEVVELLNPKDQIIQTSREECYGESCVSAVVAECEAQPLDDLIQDQEEHETREAPSLLRSTSASESFPRTSLRAKYTQTKAFKATRSVKN